MTDPRRARGSSPRSASRPGRGPRGPGGRVRTAPAGTGTAGGLEGRRATLRRAERPGRPRCAPATSIGVKCAATHVPISPGVPRPPGPPPRRTSSPAPGAPPAAPPGPPPRASPSTSQRACSDATGFELARRGPLLVEPPSAITGTPLACRSDAEPAHCPWPRRRRRRRAGASRPRAHDRAGLGPPAPRAPHPGVPVDGLGGAGRGGDVRGGRGGHRFARLKIEADFLALSASEDARLARGACSSVHAAPRSARQLRCAAGRPPIALDEHPDGSLG